MSIHGWKQLAVWSLEHACLDEGEQTKAKAIFEREWEGFCGWVVETFGQLARGLREIDAAEPMG